MPHCCVCRDHLDGGATASAARGKETFDDLHYSTNAITSPGHLHMEPQVPEREMQSNILLLFFLRQSWLASEMRQYFSLSL